MELGRPAEARKPLTLAAHLRPERRDYRIYRGAARPPSRSPSRRAAKAAQRPGALRCYNTTHSFLSAGEATEKRALARFFHDDGE